LNSSGNDVGPHFADPVRCAVIPFPDRGTESTNAHG